MKPIVRRDRSPHRRALLVGQVCVGIALLVVAGLIVGLRSTSAGQTQTTTTTVVVVAAPSLSTTTTRTPTTRPPTLLERVVGDKGSLAVQATEQGVDVYGEPGSEASSEPGGEAVEAKHLPPELQAGIPTTFLVVGETQNGTGSKWYQVLLPQRPNGSRGWVRAADVITIPLTYAVRISLSAHRLDLYEQGELRASYPVAVGKKGTVTPTGDFSMVTKVQPARKGGPYGVLAIGLSAYSDTLTDWVGGGQVAIHGTNDPARIGTDASHGCVRMKNEDITQLGAATPLGTPVAITP